MSITLAVNGRTHVLDVPGSIRLIYVLRNDRCLYGPKYGCALGECGTCAVLIDGVAARSCVLPCAVAQGAGSDTAAADRLSYTAWPGADFMRAREGPERPG